ncbi:MAG TPA: tetratricopeptide repeat protein [Gammaproteobacteria bacterium]|nr:tetratricopeptide repeat protein [Gammaproteobacteria bacterium]
MTKTIFLTSLLFLSTPSWAGDIGKARLLYENRLLDDAKRELVEVASSSSAPEEAAEALHLLGSIAIDEKRYDSAIRTWEDLLQRFPETRNAAEVSGKIALARLLLEQDSSGAAASKSSESAIVVTGIGTETEFVNQAVTEIMNLLQRGSAWLERLRGYLPSRNCCRHQDKPTESSSWHSGLAIWRIFAPCAMAPTGSSCGKRRPLDPWGSPRLE